MPKKVKHRKHQRGRISGRDKKGSEISFGFCGLKVLDKGWLSSRQIEAARRAMTRFIQRGGKIWIRVFPDKPVTAQALESPMGKGKGPVDHFVAVIRPGRILFEMDGVSLSVAEEAMRLAAHKLPLKTVFVVDEEKAEESEQDKKE